MSIIKQNDLIDSVTDALQFMSCYHPKDYIDAVYAAWEREESTAARDAMAQILVNSRMCAMGKRPICQDTGIVTVFVKVGMDVQWDADLSLADMINEGVRRAYTDPDNTLRASLLADPAGKRKNTGDNTPAVIHTEIVKGDKVTSWTNQQDNDGNKINDDLIDTRQNTLDLVHRVFEYCLSLIHI